MKPAPSLSALAAFILLLLTVVAANAAVTRWGIVPVGFGLMAPAGVWFAGASFGFRDWLHEHGGRRPVIAAIILGAAISALLADGRLAVASGVAFLVSETIDMAVYEPLRTRNWPGAVVASNMAGAVVDSLLFLAIAGFPLGLWRGQVLGKAWTILPVLALLWAVRARPGQEAIA